MLPSHGLLTLYFMPLFGQVQTQVRIKVVTTKACNLTHFCWALQEARTQEVNEL